MAKKVMFNFMCEGHIWLFNIFIIDLYFFCVSYEIKVLLVHCAIVCCQVRNLTLNFLALCTWPQQILVSGTKDNE
jgi:hypothetical protein